MNRTKVLLDTDIGTDSDDALCLAYLLLEAGCELVGVTTVGMDSSGRAALAATLCRELGQPEIPVAAGADRPLVASPHWSHHHLQQRDAIAPDVSPSDYPPDQALALMRRVIEAHPGEVVLVTVGMLTNLALLAAAEPATCAKLRAVYTMGGYRQPPGLKGPRMECNIQLDPVAAAAVLERPFARHVIAGVCATRGWHLTEAQVAEVLAPAPLAAARRCCESRMAHNGKGAVGLHDPLTAALVFDPGLAGLERGRFRLRFLDRHPQRETFLEAGELLGATEFTPEAEGPHEVVTRFEDAALDKLLATFRTAAGAVPPPSTPGVHR